MIYYAGRVTNAVYHIGIDYGEWVLIPPVRMTVSPPLLQGIIQADNDLPSTLPSQGGTLQPADGDVHKYFNPYDSPYDSYINFMNVLDNVRTRLAQEPAARTPQTV